MDNERRYYVYHEGSGTVIAMDECTLVQMDDDTADAVSEGQQKAPRGSPITDPYRAIWFNAGALRDHYEEDSEDHLEGLSDKDLDEAGEWAMNSAALWASVYIAWDYGLRMVRLDRERGRNEPE